MAFFVFSFLFPRLSVSEAAFVRFLYGSGDLLERASGESQARSFVVRRVETVHSVWKEAKAKTEHCCLPAE